MMVKHKNSAQRYRGRFLASLLAVILMLGCIMMPNAEVKASGLALGVSASSVKIGDTVTVSITVPAGVSATVNVTYPSGVFSFSSASDTANANGGTVSMTIGSYGSSNTKTTGTMKFRAKAAGSATFSASAPIAGNQDGDRVTVGGASASVRVKNESNEDDSNSSNNNSNGNSNTNGDNSNAGDDNKRKSADNSLASLTLSSGSLSPAFKYNVTNYTAEVANDVTSVVVSAKPSNAKATVESVKGGENLVVGANKIQIIVKAENGVTATYTITVTRKEDQATDEPDTPNEEPDNTDVPQEQCYEVNGVKLYPSTEGDETQIPEGFAQSEITLWENAYPYWVNEKIGNEIGLIYLTDENNENGAWYRVSESSPYEASTFICFRSEYGYIIATPEKMTETAPEGYTAETINIDGKGLVDAYSDPKDADICLIYAVNQDGVYGLYQYDVQDRTYMKYNGEKTVGDTQAEEPVQQPENTQVSDLESQNRLLFYAFIVVVTILLIVIVILVVKRRRGDADDEELDEDLDEESEDDAWEDAETDESESDLSDEHVGIRKRYDRSAFATGDDRKDTVKEQKQDGGSIDETEKTMSLADEAADEKPTEENVTTEEKVTTSTIDLESVLAQAVSETMQESEKSESDSKKEEINSGERNKKSYAREVNEEEDDPEDDDDFNFDFDEEEDEKPKKKKEKRRGLFGRRKKKDEDEDDDLEFLDL